MRKSVLGAVLAALMVTVVVAAGQVRAPLRDLDVDLLARQVFAMGGNGGPNGAYMYRELDGWFYPENPNYGLCEQRPDCADDTYDVISWNATIWKPGSGFDSQQADGVRSLDRALRGTLASLPDGDDVVVVGYSSSASVVVRYLRELSSKAAAGEDVPDPDQVRFLAIGGPNRPNGGLFARFPGLYIPIADVTTDGGNTETGYRLTDISWKYDLISDFPTYPLNLVAVANAAIGFFYLHAWYFNADPNNPDLVVSDPNWTGGAEGELTDYITFTPKHLPLLRPFYDLGFPARLLDAVEPLLTEIVEFGYDRKTPVWEATPARLLPPAEHFIEALPKFTAAIRKGVENLLGRELGEGIGPRTTRVRERLEALRADRAQWPERNRITLLKPSTLPERNSVQRLLKAGLKPGSGSERPRLGLPTKQRFADRAADRAERRAQRQAEPATT